MKDHMGLTVGRARAVAGLSQHELAKLSGVGRSTIANMESGGNGISVEKAAAIAAALGMSTSQLLGENEAQEARISVQMAASIVARQQEIVSTVYAMEAQLHRLTQMCAEFQATVEDSIGDLE